MCKEKGRGDSHDFGGLQLSGPLQERPSCLYGSCSTILVVMTFGRSWAFVLRSIQGISAVKNQKQNALNFRNRQKQTPDSVMANEWPSSIISSRSGVSFCRQRKKRAVSKGYNSCNFPDPVSKQIQGGQYSSSEFNAELRRWREGRRGSGGLATGPCHRTQGHQGRGYDGGDTGSQL